MNDVLKLIQLSGCLAPSADNSQPWRLHWNGLDIAIHYATERLARCNTFGPTEAPTLLAIGAVIENLAQAAAAYDMTAIWRRNAGEDPEICYGRLALSGSPSGPADPALVSHILDRHTNRNPYRNQPIDHAVLRGISPSQGAAQAVTLTDATVKTRVADLLRRSGELRFQTPELVAMLADSLRHTEKETARGDGLDVRTLGLPPGGALFLKTLANPGVLRAMNRVHLHKVLAWIDAQPIARAPALLCICSPADQASLIDAGRLLERNWIYLNAAGLAVHPYYALSDQLHRLATSRVAEPLVPHAREIAAATHETFGLDSDEWPQIILRIGYPTRPARRSRRLPLADIFSDGGRA